MRYLVWGIGERLAKHINILDREQVIGFVDNRTDGRVVYHGKPIILPNKISDYEFDGIIISSVKFFDEIAHQCIFELGIDCRKILRLDYYLNSGKEISCYPEIALAYHDVLELEAGGGQAGIIRNWLDKEVSEVRNINLSINKGGYLFPVSMEEGTVNIFQVAHKFFVPIGNKGYRPIGVGGTPLPYDRDNIGDNIAEYNAKINECTALYWIWKHVHSTYIGLNHYRRVFESELNARWPLQDIEVLLLLREYDVIAAKAVILQGYSVADMLRRQICQEAFDLSYQKLNDIFSDKDEEERSAFNKIMGGSIFFPCNMFIMNRGRVNEYCEWLFPILFALIDEVDIQEEWDSYSKRVIGFWAERLFTVWLYLSGYKVKQLSILVIEDGRPYGKM